MQSREEYKEYYNDFYAGQDFRHYPDSVNRAFISGIAKTFSLPARPRVLDLGCGTGMQMRVMAALDYRSTGLDLSIAGLQRAREADPVSPLVNGDAFHLPFCDAAFDAVLSLGSILNYDDAVSIREILEEAGRVTTVGGWVILATASDFSGLVKGGWKQRSREDLDRILHSVTARCYRRIETFPKLAALLGSFAFHPVLDFLIKILPERSRTIILAFQKQ